jgi:hypothetical protein
MLNPPKGFEAAGVAGGFLPFAWSVTWSSYHEADTPWGYAAAPGE